MRTVLETMLRGPHCACGCGGYAKIGNTFIAGHSNQSAERRRQSLELATARFKSGQSANFYSAGARYARSQRGRLVSSAVMIQNRKEHPERFRRPKSRRA